MPNLDNERLSVQNPIIKYSVEIGWSYISSDEALSLRGGKGGLFLYETLKRKLIDLNPGLVNVSNVDNIINKIESVRNNIEGNFEILKWLRGLKSIYIESEKREKNIILIDFSNPSNNVFNVSDEWVYTNGKNTNRADVVFLINGIPVAILEAKSAKKEIEEALIQIKRYHNETPEFLTSPQTFCITNLLHFYYAPTWNFDKKAIFEWKDNENFEIKVKTFFSRERFLKIIEEWIIFFTRDDELEKIILREHQIRAIEKIINRTLDPNKKRGLIWHTQGSGKTFTMIKTAEILLNLPVKPTVIMIVDRNELEGQLSNWIVNLLGKDFHKPIKSKNELKSVIKSEYRGLVVSMIHKFDKATEVLSYRDDIYVLIDEAHRSTGGDLGNYLIGAMPNATFIGFTGTPIDKTSKGKGTFKVFGIDDEKGYLDKYSIVKSIKDRTTVKLHYLFAPNEVRVPEDKLEKEFLNLSETEGISDIDELNRILEKAVSLKNFLKGKDRIDKIAKFVAEHFKNNVEPLGYKAFLVAVDREGCALYKKALDKYLPKDYSKVIYTKGKNDNNLLKEFYLSEDEEKRVRKEFKKPDYLPKILIVTDKLLTGYDAPVLYCMYLDKPMRDHTLLQAIARVNRPYEDENGNNKPFGLIVDFIGIFERLEKALSFDSDVVDSAIKNIDVLKERFASLMENEANEYLKLCKGKINDKKVELAKEYFADKEKRKQFFDFYKELQRLYEIISPDQFLHKYIENYKALSSLYLVIKNAFSLKPQISYDFMEKTELLVRDNVETYMKDLNKDVMLNEDVINSIKKSKDKSSAKVINLIIQIINVSSDIEKPHLISIKERAEYILEQYENKQITTEEVIKEIEKLYESYKDEEKEYKEKNMDKETFRVYWMLKNQGLRNAENKAREIKTKIQQYPEYRENKESYRKLKSELYSVLSDLIELDKEGKLDLSKLIDNILSMVER